MNWQEKKSTLIISTIAQEITEMCAFWLVEDYVISHYNHQAWGDYEALIFKMATARFVDFSEEEIKWKKMQLLW